MAHHLVGTGGGGGGGGVGGEFRKLEGEGVGRFGGTPANCLSQIFFYATTVPHRKNVINYSYCPTAKYMLIIVLRWPRNE